MEEILITEYNTFDGKMLIYIDIMLDGSKDQC